MGNDKNIQKRALLRVLVSFSLMAVVTIGAQNTSVIFRDLRAPYDNNCLSGCSQYSTVLNPSGDFVCSSAACFDCYSGCAAEFAVPNVVFVPVGGGLYANDRGRNRTRSGGGKNGKSDSSKNNTLGEAPARRAQRALNTIMPEKENAKPARKRRRK